MGDVFLNIRFGYRHFMWRRGERRPYIYINTYWIKHKPTPWFCVYTIGNWRRA